MGRLGRRTCFVVRSNIQICCHKVYQLTKTIAQGANIIVNLPAAMWANLHSPVERTTTDWMERDNFPMPLSASGSLLDCVKEVIQRSQVNP